MIFSKPEIKVGIVVFIAFVILVIAAIYIGNIKVTGGGYDFYVRFSFASDLRVRSKVKLAGGVVIGTVLDITYDEPTGLAKVKARVRDDVKIKKDADFSIYTSGLMGEKYLEVSGGTPGSGYVKEGDVIDGISPQSMDMALGKIYKVSDEFAKALIHLTSIMGSDETKNAISEMLKKTTESISGISSIVSDTKPKISSALEGFEDTTKSLSKAAENIAILSNELKEFANKENRKNLNSAFSNLNKISAKLDKTIDSLNDVIKKIDKGEGTVSLLLNDKKMAQDLKDLVDDLRKNPWKMLWKGKQ